MPTQNLLRPLVKLALSLLPGPFEKTSLTKGLKATVESIDTDLHEIVSNLKEARDQAIMFKECLKEFQRGTDYQNDGRYADAVARYKSALELCPNELTPTRATIHALRSECFLKQQLWANASTEAKISTDVSNSINGRYFPEDKVKAGVEATRARSWDVRIHALREMGDLGAATEGWFSAGYSYSANSNRNWNETILPWQMLMSMFVKGPIVESIPLYNVPAQRQGLGYKVAFRFGRSM